jgi:cysteinyl-tRNA synthetase
MSMKILGASFDLHLGGEDLIFPHHEDEIAQSEGATQKPFVKYWMHGAHLLVEGKKMSKSLGNFFTLRDLLAKGFTGREVRYLLLTAHYRETFNFTLEGLQGAKTALARIKECLEKILETAEDIFRYTTTPALPNSSMLDLETLNSFSAALDDDLNISKAWGIVFEWIRDLNRTISQNKLSTKEAIVAFATWKELDKVLGLNFDLRTLPRITEEKTPTIVSLGGLAFNILGEIDAPTEIRSLAIDRMVAKTAKDFKRADAIRDELKLKGWAIEDTPKGARLKKL